MVASVSCIYGIGNPTEFKNSILHLKIGDTVERNKFLFRLVENLYQRAGDDFERGQFRVAGDTVDIYLAYADYEKAITLDKHFTKAYLRAGKAYLSLGMTGDSLCILGCVVP